MKIEYEVAAEDFLAFNEYFLENSQIHRRQVRRGAVVCFLVLAALPVLILFSNEQPILKTATQIWPLLLGPFFGVLLFLYMTKRTIRRQLQKLINSNNANGALGQKSLTIDEDGLQETSAMGEGRTDWSAVHSVVLKDSRIFIFLKNASGLVIPHSAFTDEKQREDFVAELNRHTDVSD